MTRLFGRRKFLQYGSAALGTSILLKACAPPPDTSAEDPAASSTDAAPSSGDTIKVGLLHSLSGTMALS